MVMPWWEFGQKNAMTKTANAATTTKTRRIFVNEASGQETSMNGLWRGASGGGLFSPG
jgi:hypothetical protein